MTVGEKWFATVASIVVAIFVCMAAGSVWMGHVGWQNLNNACIARGGEVVRVNADDICATVEYKVTPR